MVQNSQLIFRPARPADKARVLDITAHTWEHGDYIAQVWDKWLADPHGELSVAELGGILVAIAKLSVLAPGELWMEGLRVASEYRRHGIAAAMAKHQLALARRIGGQTVRYATGHDNVASHTIAAQAGFRHVASWRQEIQAEVEPGASPPPVLAASDWPALQAAFARAARAPQTGGLYEQDWRWYTLTPERLRAHLEAGQLSGLRRANGQLAAWAITSTPDDSEHLHVHYLRGQAGALARLAHALRQQAALAGKQGVYLNVPENETLLEALETAGCQLSGSNKIHIFSMSLEVQVTSSGSG